MVTLETNDQENVTLKYVHHLSFSTEINLVIRIIQSVMHIVLSSII